MSEFSKLHKLFLGAFFAFKTLFVFSFFILTASGVLPANSAASADQCTGENLIAKFARENPDRFAELEAVAQRDWQNGNTKLFKVEKEGVVTSWIYGTAHVTDPRVLDLSSQARAAFDGSQSLLVEIVDIEKSARAAFANPKLRDALFLTDGSTLEDKLTQEQVDAIKARLAAGSTPWFLAKRMRPWLVMGLVAAPACELARKQSGTPVLDAYLQEEAKELDKQIVGLETVEEQFSALGALGADMQLQALSEIVDSGSLIDDMHVTMIELYLEGNIGLIWPMIAEFSGDDKTESESARAQYEKIIVVDRNRRMAERALPYVEKGGAFVAVGSLHLPGREGLVELLRGEGFTLTAVDEVK